MRLIGFLLLITICSSFGQDRVITTKGDSLSGSIKILSYDLLDRVQINGDKKKVLTAIQVRSIVIEGETYRPARSGNAVRFMKVLKQGYLSLYAFRQESQSQFDGRMLIKLDGKSIEVPNLAFKKVMLEFLEDCESIVEKIKSGELGRKNLDAIIDGYNKCLNDKTNELSKAAAIVETSKDKLGSIAALRSKIETAGDPKSKDALDILNDIETKVKKGDAIPNYQIEALKGLLANLPDVSKELEQTLSLLR